MDSFCDTALCLIPPKHLWGPINQVRSFYDHAHDKWPPHINVVYPFVASGDLLNITRILCQSAFRIESENGSHPLHIELHDVDTFTHKSQSTVFLHPKPGHAVDTILQLRNRVHVALGRHSKLNEPYRLHMTVAQSKGGNSAHHQLLLEKARLLTPVAWDVAHLAILVRDRADEQSKRDMPLRMRPWCYIDLVHYQLTQMTVNGGSFVSISNTATEVSQAQPRLSYQFNALVNEWHPMLNPLPTPGRECPSRLIIASYDTSAESESLPNRYRHTSLVSNIISSRAAADIIVLQEVTDQFLRFVLSSKEIQDCYPFSTHASLDQPGSKSLPALGCIVVLSKFPLRWTYLPFQEKCKGSAVVVFPTLLANENSVNSPPLVLAACHFSQCLDTDAVVTKRNELETLLFHLSTHFRTNPWILAGGFKLPASANRIDAAKGPNNLSAEFQGHLTEIENLMLNVGLEDAWMASRLEVGDSLYKTTTGNLLFDLHEGEQGATFDPLSNGMVAKTDGSSVNNSPQRYNGIFVNDRLVLRPSAINMFGETILETETDGVSCHVSNHWGIRCLLMQKKYENDSNIPFSSIQSRVIKLYKAPPSLGGLEQLKNSLSSFGCLPTLAEVTERKDALRTLERALLGSEQISLAHGPTPKSNTVLIPVGSFGLGVWTSSSNVDCLCIGDITSRTFFALAVQKLRKARPEGITILHRVEAKSGTMLELDIRGIKFDLHYCLATCVIERWPQIFNSSIAESEFAMPPQILSKLSAVRDLSYLRSSIPDMVQYRTAHLLIKAWAVTRGLYGAKFGLLGDIHITGMLVPVCKVLAQVGRTVSTVDIVTTFFHHYTNFSWDTQLVHDPFFHKNIKYHRAFREPLCILGWHGPSLNTASNIDTPTIRAMAIEFSRASDSLSQKGVSWDKFLNSSLPSSPSSTLAGKGGADFLQSYKTYIKIDARHWGLSTQKRRKFVEWLESRYVAMLVDITRKCPLLMPRIWPGRFLEKSMVEEAVTNTEYHYCYLIGLAWNDNGKPSGKSRDGAQVAEGALYEVLRNFEERIRGNDKYYDSSSCWMVTEILNRDNLNALILEDDTWNPADAVEADIDEVDPTRDMDGDLDAPEIVDELTGFNYRADLRSKKDVHHRPLIVAKPPGLGKFRTAADVMNRIRWDVALNISDYVVGYLDRFIGACEILLEQWKSEQTDEEFIPQHRILYFKRKSDGVIVWERRSRIDKIFGSGV